MMKLGVFSKRKRKEKEEKKGGEVAEQEDAHSCCSVIPKAKRHHVSPSLRMFYSYHHY